MKTSRTKTKLPRRTPGQTPATRPPASPPPVDPSGSPPLNPKSEIPNHNSEIVLLAVTGMSPAVLTETIWALAHEPEPVIPHRVIAVTTAAGRAQIVKQLFQDRPQFGGRSPWDALRQSLIEAGHDLTGRLRFGATGDDLRVITAADPATGRTRELDDLRTAADNEAAADFLLEQVRTIVANPDTRLIASVAGGRKTMGALLYAAVTLAARETDRITHVLVSEPFEILRDFWYPAQPGGPVAKCEVRNAKSEVAAPPDAVGFDPAAASSSSSFPSASPPQSFDPATARIELADLPFVPLRNLFHRELGRQAGTFSRLVAGCRDTLRRRAAETLRLTVDTQRAELDVSGTRCKLAPSEMLLLWFLARRAKQGEPPFTAYKDALDSLNQLRREQREAHKDFNDWRHADSLRADWEDRAIVRTVADLRDRLRRAGGDAALLAACLPEKGRCSLDLPGALIFLT